MKASFEHARELGQERIDTEHLLLGVLADKTDTSIRVLTELSVDVAVFRRTLISRSAEG